MRKFKLKEEIQKGYAGIPYDLRLIFPALYIKRKLRKYPAGKERAAHGFGIMMANVLIGDLRKRYKKANLRSQSQNRRSIPHPTARTPQ